MIEQEPSFGYRTVAWLLGFNKNTVQRVFQLKGWQVRKRPVGMRPRIEPVPSVAKAPNERWSTDMCRVWAGRDGWATLSAISTLGTVWRDCVAEGLRLIFIPVGVEDDEEPKGRASETRDDQSPCRASREGHPACDAQVAFF